MFGRGFDSRHLHQSIGNKKCKILQNINLQGFVFSRATPQNVKKRILPVAYSDCPFSHRYIGSHTVPSRRILAVFDRFLPAVRTGRRQLTIYRFFIFAECFYGLSTDRENIPAGNLYFWGWLARNGIDCPMRISSRRDDKRRGGRISPHLFFSSEYGVWKGVRHIQCKAIRKGLRNLSVRPPISFFRDIAGRSYLIVKPNDTPTFVGPK